MKKVSVIIVLSLLLFACKTGEKLTKNNSDGDYFEIKKGQTFEIHFTTNASLGLSWTWANRQSVSIVDSLPSRYVNNYPKEMVGSSTERYWSFKGIKQGIDTLHFNYCRGGDPSTSVKTKSIVVKVK